MIVGRRLVCMIVTTREVREERLTVCEKTGLYFGDRSRRTPKTARSRSTDWATRKTTIVISVSFAAIVRKVIMCSAAVSSWEETDNNVTNILFAFAWWLFSLGVLEEYREIICFFSHGLSLLCMQICVFVYTILCFDGDFVLAKHGFLFRWTGIHGKRLFTLRNTWKCWMIHQILKIKPVFTSRSVQLHVYKDLFL